MTFKQIESLGLTPFPLYGYDEARYVVDAEELERALENNFVEIQKLLLEELLKDPAVKKQFSVLKEQAHMSIEKLFGEVEK